MKYPEEQFETLKETVKALSKVFENIKEVHPSKIYSLVVNQHSEGQLHNSIVITEEGLYTRRYIAEDLNVKFTPLIEPKPFVIYPNGCEDSHIQTAVKKALKSI